MFNIKKACLIGIALTLITWQIQAATIVNPTVQESCTKDGTTSSMTFKEAKNIAEHSICLKVGKLLPKKHWCNPVTGTWWISLKTKLHGCSPACVINVVDKTVSVNYMCSGLLRSDRSTK